MSYFTIDHVFNNWQKEDIYYWLSDLIFTNESRTVLLDPLRPIIPQIILGYDKIETESKRECLKEIISDILKRWIDSAHLNTNLQNELRTLQLISSLSLYFGSKRSAYLSFHILTDPRLFVEKIFLENCADILIDTICLFIDIDEFYQSIKSIFYKPEYWQYRPTIFFKVTSVRRLASFDLIPLMLQTLSDHEDYFDTKLITERFWKEISPEEALELIEIHLSKENNILFINQLIANDYSPVKLMPFFYEPAENFTDCADRNKQFYLSNQEREKLVDKPIRQTAAIAQSNISMSFVSGSMTLN